MLQPTEVLTNLHEHQDELVTAPAPAPETEAPHGEIQSTESTPHHDSEESRWQSQAASPAEEGPTDTESVTEEEEDEDEEDLFGDGEDESTNEEDTQ
jgi:hypothetical protein